MFTLPQLPYAFSALEPYIDALTMEIHHDRHHAAYIKNLNDALAGQDKWLSMPIEEVMKNLSQVPEELRTKVRNNGGGHYNHSLFWEVMSPNNDGTLRKPQGAFASAIDTSFGSFEKFQSEFSATAMGRFGSGWVWLVSEQGKLSITDTPNQDNPLMEGKTPILGLDVWEHAYYLKYQNKRVDYVTAWWSVVNWAEVDRRFGGLA